MILYPVVGIPKWKWKKELCLYAIENPNIISTTSDGLCYEGSRHFELLDYFKKQDTNYKDTEYYKYQILRGRKKKVILKKILDFKTMYRDIKKNGCINSPIITDDGCRLDGSHRIAILITLGFEKINVNVATYEDVFSKKKSKQIREQVIAFRQKVYEL